MKYILKIILVILIIFITSCSIMIPNIMIGPTGEVQDTYIENFKYFK